MKVALNELLAGIETLALSPYVREIWIYYGGEWVNIVKPLIHRGLIVGTTEAGQVMLDKDGVTGLRYKLVQGCPVELHGMSPPDLLAHFDEEHRRWRRKKVSQS